MPHMRIRPVTDRRGAGQPGMRQRPAFIQYPEYYSRKQDSEGRWSMEYD
jgi:hypothetical protein